MIYYTIYKTTNKINGKYYIGKHQTKDLNDAYLGSGKLLKRAIKKYGVENFSKEILFVFDNEEQMNAKEKELVIVSEETYNLCPGGHGGFGYINANSKLFKPNSHKNFGTGMLGKKHKPGTIAYLKFIKTGPKNYMYGNSLNVSGEKNPMFGKKHSNKTKLLMSEIHSGTKNSQFGTCWITNDTENKKIKKELLDEYLNKGYRKGRIF